jgi:oligoribonuclease NrnB/cAMP/cGMP phosphodiesterase (DHH superfamily)
MARPVIHVVSHGPHCLDGVAAAAAVARFHEGADVRATFASNQEVNGILRELEPRRGEQLWITDISWSAPETEEHLRQLVERGVELHWFDHHKTAIERLRAGGYRLAYTTRVVRDDFAASKLVYDFLAARAAERGVPAPARFAEFAPIVAMADDNDRWLHRIRGSRELGLVLRAMPASESYASFLAMDASGDDTPAMAAARARVQEELARNRRLAEGTRVDRRVGEVSLTAALCDGYAGEIADEWGRNSPRTVFALFDVRSGAISFRRSPDLDYDLSALAERLGGGGHPAASGATVAGLAAHLGDVIARVVETAMRAAAAGTEA